MEDQTPHSLRTKLRATLLRTIDKLHDDVWRSKSIRRETPPDYFVLHEFLDMSIECYEQTIEHFEDFMRDYFGDVEGLSLEEVARELAKQALYEAAESVRGKR